MKRIFPLIIFIVVLLYVTKGYWRHREPEARSNFSTTFQLPVRVKSISRGALSETISFPTELKAVAEVNVTANIPGRIEHLFVKEGSRVVPGNRLIKLSGPKEGSPDFFEDLLVKAPLHGVVTRVWQEVGNAIKKDDILITIAQIETLHAVVDLPEQYYGSLPPYLTAEIKLHAYPDQIFQGKLATARPQIDPQSRTAYLAFLIPNRGALLPGMSGTLTLPLTSRQAGWILPLEALFAEGEKSFVFVYRAGKAKRYPVNVLTEGIDKVVVQGAFQEGEAVLTTRSDALRDGDAVTVVP